MQAVRSDPLTNYEAEQIAAFVEDLTGDSAVRVSITYNVHDSRYINTETGDVTDFETDASITALRAEVSHHAVDASGGTLQVGDRWYLITASDLSADPETNDAITDGSEQWEVQQWKKDPTGAAYIVAARRV